MTVVWFSGLLAGHLPPGPGIGEDQASRAPVTGTDTPLWRARFTTDAPSRHDRDRIGW
ncbi:hypothetical protein [Haloarchaeobius iranensis]|uniref:Uncharacterized protein n=1 Tax=Haloarchaeobius iranensis TaxID=996166 RepID=A0A1G9Z803_9EURY|nr:hypothetical protein [Haloarchaeobius iranensis]SDN17267.1 hypothetical protein SAMN05192554_11866 [Haloarchaeobius iranensis]